MIYLISSIKEISQERIVYYDNDGVEQTIDLFECSKNWVEHFNNNEYITWEGNPAPKIEFETNKCVGERDWFAEKPYFEFFSNPKIRFEIQPKKKFSDHFKKYWVQRYHAEFHKISLDLRKFGWETFDLG